jgi:hypothetical protein
LFLCFPPFPRIVNGDIVAPGSINSCFRRSLLSLPHHRFTHLAGTRYPGRQDNKNKKKLDFISIRNSR